MPRQSGQTVLSNGKHPYTVSPSKTDRTNEVDGNTFGKQDTKEICEGFKLTPSSK